MPTGRVDWTFFSSGGRLDRSQMPGTRRGLAVCLSVTIGSKAYRTTVPGGRKEIHKVNKEQSAIMVEQWRVELILVVASGERKTTKDSLWVGVRQGAKEVEDSAGFHIQNTANTQTPKRPGGIFGLEAGPDCCLDGVLWARERV